MANNLDKVCARVESILGTMDAIVDKTFAEMSEDNLKNVARDLRSEPLKTLAVMTHNDIGRINSAALLSTVFMRAALRKTERRALEGEEVDIDELPKFNPNFVLDDEDE